MRRQLFTLAGLIAIMASSAGSARAQHSQYLFPVEKGILESHVDVQYQFSKPDTFGGDHSSSILSVEGQYVFIDRLEVSLNVPLIAHNAINGASFLEGTQLGDIILAGKFKVLGLADVLQLSTYLNFTLPTHSGDQKRNYFVLQAGAAVEGSLLGIVVGGNAQLILNVIGDNIDDTGLIGLNAFAQLPIFWIIGAVAALEYYNSLYPDTDLNAFVVTPGLEVSLLGFHGGISARIATTDDAKSVVGGRVALLFNAGYRF